MSNNQQQSRPPRRNARRQAEFEAEELEELSKNLVSFEVTNINPTVTVTPVQQPVTEIAQVSAPAVIPSTVPIQLVQGKTGGSANQRERSLVKPSNSIQNVKKLNRTAHQLVISSKSTQEEKQAAKDTRAITNVLSQHEDEIKSINRQATSIRGTLTNGLRAINGLNSQMSHVKEDVKGLKNDVSVLNERLQEMQRQLEEFKNNK